MATVETRDERIDKLLCAYENHTEITDILEFNKVDLEILVEELADAAQGGLDGPIPHPDGAHNVLKPLAVSEFARYTLRRVLNMALQREADQAKQDDAERDL